MNVRSRKLERFIHSQVRGVPLWVIGTCGLAGILVDIDHPIAYWITGKTPRADHKTLAIISCLILCGVSAYIGGLYTKLVLKRGKGTLMKFIITYVISWSIIIAIIILGYWLLVFAKNL